MSRFPLTPTKGAFKGRTFQTKAEYEAALAERRAAEPQDSPPASVGGGLPTGRRGAGKGANGVTSDMALGLVQLANLGLTFASIPLARRDAALGLPPEASELALDDVEQAALVGAILDTARANKRFAAVVKRLCTVQASTNLGLTVGAIVTIRLARRGVLPPMAAFGAYAMLGTLSGQAVDVEAAAVPEQSPNGQVHEDDAPTLLHEVVP